MADRKATNKYIPPDFDPKKHKSINAYQKSHHLRERARKIGQGILIVRFEMPWNAYCTHCDKMLAMGVRYNAEKKSIGKYYSTKIYSFRMKCHLCGEWIEIHTDPKHSEYVAIEGVRRKVEEFSAEDAGTIVLMSEEERTKLHTDPMLRLEHSIVDKQKSSDVAPTLTALEEANRRVWADPYEANAALRQKFRESKLETTDKESIQDKYSLSIEISSPHPTDSLEAAKAFANKPKSFLQKKQISKKSAKDTLKAKIMSKIFQ